MGHDEYCVVYSDGSFESQVPGSALRLSAKKAPRVAIKKALGKRQRNELLRDAANMGDVATVKQLLHDGASPDYMDTQGYTPMHWASGPEDGMPGDTPERCSCIALCAL